jgi:hypothetical protein
VVEGKGEGKGRRKGRKKIWPNRKIKTKKKDLGSRVY